jgi:hypothetical protein
VFFAGQTIAGRHGLRKGAQFPVQDRRWIRAYVGASDQTPFHELHDVVAVVFPTRHFADRCIMSRLDVTQARALLKEAEADLAAVNAALEAS